MYAMKRLKETKIATIIKIGFVSYACGKINGKVLAKIDPMVKITIIAINARITSFLTGDPMIGCLESFFFKGEQLKHTSFFPDLLMQFGQTNFLHLSHLNQLSVRGGPDVLQTGHHPPAY